MSLQRPQLWQPAQLDLPHERSNLPEYTNTKWDTKDGFTVGVSATFPGDRE